MGTPHFSCRYASKILDKNENLLMWSGNLMFLFVFRVTTAVDGSTIDDKSVLSNESTIAQPPSIRPSSPQKEIDSQIKVELRTYEGLGVRKASTSELLDTADVKEQISR
jgi:hypothetical protein